jgi:hypothetical protein
MTRFAAAAGHARSRGERDERPVNRQFAAPSRDAFADVAAYYRDPAVQLRLREYCGGTAREAPTAAYVATLRDDGRPHLTWDRSRRVPAAEMATLFHDCGDLSRSLWDTQNLLFVLDLDHQNIDAPAEPFIHPADVFVKLEPAWRATRDVLRSAGLQALDIMTGRGYHFTGRIPLDHPVVDLLAGLLPGVPSWYANHKQRRPPAVTATLSMRQAQASVGLGLILEFLAHKILYRASRSSPIPVVVNGTIVGRGASGRECVSVDFSHAGDPLDVRHVRVAFGAYQWHRFRPDIFGLQAASFPPLVALPRRQRSLISMLTASRGLDSGLRSSRRSDATLPDVSVGVERLVTEYGASSLAEFHRAFLSEVGTSSARQPDIDRATLPPCLARCLETPNDLLLRPEHLQYLTRGLLARGWRASQVAALVQAQYEGDYGWGDRWTRMHPRTRAEFDVRVFAGLVAAGIDRMVDHNCVSAQEKGVCPGTGCAYDLRLDRDRLLRGRM